MDCTCTGCPIRDCIISWKWEQFFYQWEFVSNNACEVFWFFLQHVSLKDFSRTGKTARYQILMAYLDKGQYRIACISTMCQICLTTSYCVLLTKRTVYEMCFGATLYCPALSLFSLSLNIFRFSHQSMAQSLKIAPQFWGTKHCGSYQTLQEEIFVGDYFQWRINQHVVL